MELRTKIIAAVAVLLLITIGITTSVALNLQGKRMMSSKIGDVKILSNIILKSIENSMGQGNTEDVQKSIENIGENREVLSLRIIAPSGVILKSMRPAELGLRASQGSAVLAEDIKARHVVGNNSITYYTPVLNRVQCFGCHSESEKINGIIEINYDITKSLADISALKRLMIFANIFTVMAVLGLLSIMLSKLIMNPLGKMMASIKTVESGDWNTKVEINTDDELGAIGIAFNRMVEEIKSLYESSLKKEKEISRVKVELDHKVKLEELNARLQHKVKEVETANKAVLSLSKEVKVKNIELEKMIERLKSINDVGRVLTSIIETDELIKLVIRTTAELLKVQSGSIHIMRDERTSITMQYTHGIGVERVQHLSMDLNPLYADLLKEGKPVLFNGDDVPRLSDQRGDSMPALGVPIKMKGQVIGGLLLEKKVDGTMFTADELELLGTMANQAMVAIENAWLYETVKNNYFGTIQALVNALEASDRYTKGHSERVKYLGLKLGMYIGLDYKEMELFEHAAILHDIGKIGIDTSVLNKETKLTNAEFSLIQAHPIIGDEILGPIGTLQGVRTTILQHHEKYDGTGYPYGITGDEISLKARILTVVDTFDAMLTDRPYRKALSISLAKAELKRGAGTQFDPFIVNSFLQLIDENESILIEAGYNVN